MDDHRDLSGGERRVLAQLRYWYGVSLRKGKTFAHPSQEQLAEELGCSVASVKRYLRKLDKERKLIKRVRGILGNRYYLLDPKGAQPTPAQGSDCTDRRGQSDPCAGISLTPAIREERRQHKQEQQQHPAAADLLSPLEVEDAEKALLGLGFPRQLSRRYAERDPRLAVVVATYCAERFQDPRQKPVANKIGFIRKLLDDPLNNGLDQVPGGWLPARAPKQHRDETTAERLERTRRQMLARRAPAELGKSTVPPADVARHPPAAG